MPTMLFQVLPVRFNNGSEHFCHSHCTAAHPGLSANIASAFRISYSIRVSAPRHATSSALLLLHRRLTVFADVRERRMRH